MARLQFRHLNDVFENREGAIAYISDLTDANKIVSTQFGESLIGEPLAVKYKTDDDEVHVILAIGKEGNKGEDKHVPYHIIDSAKYEEDIAALSGIAEDIKEQLEELAEEVESLNERVDVVESAITEINEKIDELSGSTIKEININVDDQWEGSGYGTTAIIEDGVANITLTTDNVRISDGYEGQLIHHDHSMTEFISAVEGIHLEKEDNPEELPANVREQYKLVDGDNHQLGDTVVRIYKDSSVYKAYIGHMDDTIVSPIDPTVIPGTGDEALCIIYYTTDGTYQLVAINLEDFIVESEFGDGLQVVNHIVSVKIDSESEDFLTVGPSGVKLSGVQEAIDEAKDALQAELDNTQVGAGLADDGSYVHDHSTHYIDEATSLADADHKLDAALYDVETELDEVKDTTADLTNRANIIESALTEEISRAMDKEDELEGLISELNDGLAQEISDRETGDNELSQALEQEVERATNKESELQEALNQEIVDRQENDVEINNRIDNLENSVSDSVDYLNDRITNITGQEGDTYKKHNTTPDDNANYINVAESMDDADFILDQKLGELSASTVSEVERLDGEISTVRSTLTSQINELSNTLSDEISERQAADEALDARIDSLEAKQIEGHNAIDVSTADTQIVSLIINEEDKVLTQSVAGLKTNISVDILSENDKEYILLKGLNGAEISRVDATTFIKDGMLDSVTWIGESNILQFVFNTDSGKSVINIDFSKFVNDEINRQIANLQSAITIINGDVNTPNSTYYKIDDRLVKYAVAGSAIHANGTLIRYYEDAEGHKYYVSNDANDMVYSGTNLQNVITQILNNLNDVTEDVNELHDIVYDLKDDVYEIKDDVSDLKVKLQQEIDRSTSEDTALWSALTKEVADRTEADNELNDKIDDEIERSTAEDERLDEKIDTETERAMNEEAALWSAITSGSSYLEEKLNQEIERSTGEDVALWSALTKEIADRTEADNEIELVTSAALNDLNDRIIELSANTGNNYYTKNEIDETVDGLFSDAGYVSSAKTIVFYNNDGEILDTIDATDFIKDGMVNNAEVTVPTSGPHSGETCLVITFNTDAGKENIEIPIDDIFDADNYYTKQEVDDLFEPIESALTKEIADRTEADNELNDKIDAEIERAQNEEAALWSALTIQIQHSDERDDEIELVTSSALNDLNSRLRELSANTKNNYYTKNQIDTTVNGLVADAEYVSSAKTIVFYNNDGEAIDTIDATDFIKDGMVNNVEITTPTSGPHSGEECLVITFNTDAGKENIEIPIDDIFDADNYYTKQEVDDLIAAIDVSDQIAPLWSALTQEVADRAEADESIWSALTKEIADRAEADEDIWSALTKEIADRTEADNIINSAITEIESAITEIEQIITDDEFVISSALNDLNDRIIDVSAITATKQEILISGVNLKTINNQNLLGSGNINIEGGSSGVTYTAGDNINIDANNVISVTGITVPTSNTAFTNDANYVTSADTKTQIENYHYVTSANTKTQVENYHYITSADTISDIKINGVSKGSTGIIDLGTVITAETQLSTATTGNGNAVTSLSVSNHKITMSKGSTFTTSGDVKTQIESYNYITSAYTDTNYYTKPVIDSMFAQISGTFQKVTTAEYNQMYSGGTLNPDTLYVIID